ncbi:cytoplasmic dynein 2 heavy chain 1-like isoform X1 [Octopus vulgaris]|uniref:Cytoplasmic dynein 2 heavy chain 1 n=1 Tax=Octopus vulgaris TaxID=6645 RepID=A0AA36FFS7_OCTVU|nr:cytoplasmic dynein 2 heavy chain 1-like isoform X1 [Octopus vulgaris]
MQIPQPDFSIHTAKVSSFTMKKHCMTTDTDLIHLSNICREVISLNCPYSIPNGLLVGDQQCLLQSLKDSPYFKNFLDKATIWEKRLASLDEYLQNLYQIQHKWVYLEPIFGRGALPKEQNRFKRVDSDFRAIMTDIQRDRRYVSLANRVGLCDQLKTMVDQLQRCQKALNEFLEEKRSSFPRFYFIGDEDLLEILGQSTKPDVIQTHLKKLFAGIHTVKFNDDCSQILAMRSLHGEVVPLRQQVLITTDVELWMNSLATEMKETLKDLLKECLQESQTGQPDPNNFPSQILCLVGQIQFTQQCENAIKQNNLNGYLHDVKHKLDVLTRKNVKCEDILELKLKALILDMVHGIDVIQQLMAANVTSVTDWHWQKQLRYYTKNTNLCIIKMVDAEFNYTFEYQGNIQKLVHTPLTDKCYLTLTQGMHMGLGGNPYGPAGTGKTESVKALGGLFGRQVLVFNCDESLDVKSMGRIFIGLVKCGAWGCFDEFNRLEPPVLSAVSMQIQVIQDAIKNKSKHMELLGKNIEIDHNSGIFITMNPAGKGYGGRQKLPDNLKQLFRPVAMSKPDNEQIAEVILFSDGFKEAKMIGRKLVTIFNLSKQLLTPQQHYDWGLRAMKTVLRGCASLLQKARDEDVTIDETVESMLVVQALRFNTLSKLTFSDSSVFDSLVQDIFPGVSFKDIQFENVAQAFREVCEEQNLTIDETQVKKALELYEQLKQRMGIVIVGPSGSGKSTLWSVLRQALAKIGQTVKQYTMNPKAMPRTQLLGHIDMDTREWTDGVLTNSARQVVKEPLDIHSWIICDGDIDPEWIESLNSVLDDNRLLTMPSGERIQFGPNVNFIFETHDLVNASPATISRMGMIFLSDENINMKGLVQSWLQSQDELQQLKLNTWIDDYFYSALDWVIRQNDLVVETSLVGILKNGLSHLGQAKSKAHFAVCLIRGLGANLNPKSRAALAQEVFSVIGETPPDSQHILDTYYDEETGRLKTYSLQDGLRDEHLDLNSLEQGSQLPIIKTVHVQRNLDYFSLWLQDKHYQPFILVGPEGCGKSLLLHHCFEQLRSVSVATVHCNAQTTPLHILQKLDQMCLIVSTNTGRRYRPKEGERLILYLKGINLPRHDKWQTCQLIAFLRQIFTFGGFYNSSLEWVGLESVQIVASMNAGTSLGRHKLSTRFTSIVRICSISYPDHEQLKSVYMAYLSSILHQRLPSHPIWSNPSKIHSLAGSMVQLYEQLQAQFSVDDYSHYLFTPCDLTQWILNLLRYDLRDTASSNSSEHILEIWAYEASRLFRDRIVGPESRSRFDQILMSIIQADWSADVLDKLQSFYHVTWGSRSTNSSTTSQKRNGKPLGRLSRDDLKSVIEKGLRAFCYENKIDDMLIFKEVIDHIARVDRVLTMAGGSLLMAGSSGVGRRSAVRLVAFMHQMHVFSPKVSRSYSIKQFKLDLKGLFQLSGIEDQHVLLLIEDHTIFDSAMLELVNSLLSAGEIPGLYTPEELGPLLQPLKDTASESGFTGSLFSFFVSRVKRNLHVALIMDFKNQTFAINCESNPALYKYCTVQWMDSWSRDSMVRIPEMLLAEKSKEANKDTQRSQRHSHSGKDHPFKAFLQIHEACHELSATPRRYIAFLNTYLSVYQQKKEKVAQQIQHLQAGVSKLNEAKELVAELKAKAATQSQLLVEKQSQADAALKEITKSMVDAGDQKNEMVILKQKATQENQNLESRKKKIDAELAEIEPLVNEAKKAVGSIQSEALSEIRSLRAPPNTIRCILEAVLCIMGIYDTSWVSMKSFLGKRGVEKDIQSFNARRITPDIRNVVEELLRKNKDAFEAKNARRASVAVESLAVWVKANLKFSYVLQKIEPLEAEQAQLQRNLDDVEDSILQLSSKLDSVDSKVAELKGNFELLTREALELKHKLEKENETIQAAETLVTKLEGEHQRWNEQISELKTESKELPKHALLSAACITYLPSTPEDIRQKMLKEWLDMVGLQQFSLRRFLSTESEQLQWKSEGLPSDDLTMENALMILKTSLPAFLVDPSSRATEWLKSHLKNHQVEVINQQDSNFQTSLELAVRFGKTLIIQEIEAIEPLLYPLLRKDLISQGPRCVVQIGEKIVHYNEAFKVYLATRNSSLQIPPDARSIMTEVNFTTTAAGLTSQLLAQTIQHEKPQLEVRKTQLLQQEEELKIQLAKLEESLLEELANAKGNILENKELLASLNKMKASSNTVTDSLQESVQLQTALDQERNTYLPLAENGSRLYFVIKDLVKINNMYCFSLSSFLRLFQRTLQAIYDESTNNTESRIKLLQKHLLHLVYKSVCRSLFKADQLMFALHLAHRWRPDQFKDNEWELLSGTYVSDFKISAQALEQELPSWIEDRECAMPVAILKYNFSELYGKLNFQDSNLWTPFLHSRCCEQEFPKAVENNLSKFQRLLVIHAVRPDRLQTAMTQFACWVLGLTDLAPPTFNLKKLFADETVATEPILIIISPGADPSHDLQELAAQTIGSDRYYQVAMGQGQANVALELLRQAAHDGDWLCLKNLHLVTSWLPVLEKEINSLKPNNGFRLWLTTEVHPHFPSVLLQSSLKITYESPPGLKKSLQRTYEAWSSEYLRQGSENRANALFALAWFHAVVQERRTYIPQGWTKFYEFNSSDLRAGADIIDRLFRQSGHNIQWQWIHGLFEQAIYGGRVDNTFDIRVLVSYLKTFFDNRVLGEHVSDRRIGNLQLPNSCQYRDYISLIDKLPDYNQPSLFGLPENIERSSQKTISNNVIGQLRILMRSDIKGSKFDKEVWSSELGPILKLWKKLNQGQQLIHMKVTPPKQKDGNTSPLLAFIQLEKYNAIKLIQFVHLSLASLSKVIRGSTLLTASVQQLAEALLNQETPIKWLDFWDGPENPVNFLRGLVSRTSAVLQWVEMAENNTILDQQLDLSNLFHPGTFLDAFRQQTARAVKCSMDNLRFVCNWQNPSAGAYLTMRIGGLLLEGCIFDGRNLSDNQPESPTVCALPPCYISWIPKNVPDKSNTAEYISLPLYYSSQRDRVVTYLDLPCTSSDPNHWLQCGAAVFLSSNT